MTGAVPMDAGRPRCPHLQLPSRHGGGVEIPAPIVRILSAIGNYELTALYIGTGKTSLPPSAALASLKSKGFWCIAAPALSAVSSSPGHGRSRCLCPTSMCSRVSAG